MTVREAIEYESAASGWWMGFVYWKWGSELCARYLAWKVRRKLDALKRQRLVGAQIVSKLEKGLKT